MVSIKAEGVWSVQPAMFGDVCKAERRESNKTDRLELAQGLEG